MRALAAVLLLALAPAPSRPIPHASLLAIDAKATGRNYLPTRMLAGFAYYRWSFKAGVTRVEFRNRAGQIVQWRIEPMRRACDTGKQKSFQLAGNKVWWARAATEQDAWRCVFDQSGKEIRLVAASTTPPAKLADTGLGLVAASAKRY